MPSKHSDPFLKTLQAKNYLDWISELESKLSIRNLSNDIVSVALAEDSLLENIMELADREVDGTERCNVFLSLSQICKLTSCRSTQHPVVSLLLNSPLQRMLK